jgi:hypothetical protein
MWVPALPLQLLVGPAVMGQLVGAAWRHLRAHATNLSPMLLPTATAKVNRPLLQYLIRPFLWNTLEHALQMIDKTNTAH